MLSNLTIYIIKTVLSNKNQIDLLKIKKNGETKKLNPIKKDKFTNFKTPIRSSEDLSLKFTPLKKLIT